MNWRVGRIGAGVGGCYNKLTRWQRNANATSAMEAARLVLGMHDCRSRGSVLCSYMLGAWPCRGALPAAVAQQVNLAEEGGEAGGGVRCGKG